MDLRFHRDGETGEPHCAWHGVTEAEVAEVLASPLEELRGRDGATIALGQNEAGRYLQVIHVPDADGEATFVITAYPMGPVALRALRRRLRVKS